MRDQVTTTQVDPAWNWRPDQWAWSPGAGRWSVSLGLPQAPLYFELSTDGVPIGSRYEFWRNLVFYSFDADPPSPETPGTFSARSQCLVGDPAQLYLYRSDPISGNGVPADRSDDRETYVLGLVLEGERRHQQAGETAVTSRAGEFFVFDNRWRSRVEWSRHRALHLSLARADVERTLGGQIPPPDKMLGMLEASRMGQALKAQLRIVTGHMAKANGVERSFLLGQLMQFALFTCENATADLPASGERRTGLLAAALQVIEQNLARPGFDTAAIQAELGCSRATLYRAFAAIDASVADTITRMRVERAKALMARSPNMPIGLVATRCGWYDSATFARAFRRLHGITPSEFRESRSKG